MSCPKCGGTGYIEIEALGLKVKCSCMIESPVKPSNKADITPEKPFYHVSGAQKELAVSKGLIPESRKDDEFDEDFFKERVIAMCKAQNCQVMDFQKYINTLNEVLVGISTGTLRKSFIIGAPNGFGKTTFVYTCLKRLLAMGKKVVPYISLFELAGLREEYEKRAWGYIFKKKESVDNEEQPTYTWNDYMQADVLFTYMTGLENMKLESRILKTIMEIRGPKELPTIVMTALSLKPYLMNPELKQFVWDDILAYSDDMAGCDRLVHRSCFKIYNTKIKITKGEDY